MGTWGTGNFDSDASLDAVDRITAGWTQAVTYGLFGDMPMSLDEAEEAIMPRLGMLLAFAEAGIGAPPDAMTVGSWRRAYLDMWDRDHRQMGGDAAFNRVRRCEIVRTFDALARLARREPRRQPKLRCRPRGATTVRR